MATFLLPLALGPVLAMALAWLLARGGGNTGRVLGLDASSCVCAAPAIETGASGAALAHAAVEVDVAHEDDCAGRNAVKIRVGTLIDAGHLSSATAVGFARGLNDTPKILGLLVGGAAIEPMAGALAIAFVMAAGGLLAARRVAETLSQRITPMSHAQGLAANATTSLLVIAASRFGLPVSTTHVSTGGIFGIGASGGTLSGAMTGQILAAWLGTLPLAAGLGALFASGLA